MEENPVLKLDNIINSHRVTQVRAPRELSDTGLTACRLGADRDLLDFPFLYHLPLPTSPLSGDCAARHAALLNCSGSAAAVGPRSPTDPFAMAVQGRR
jgi:hypothetical protein